MKPLTAVLTGISLAMQDADIDDCEVQISGDLFDFTIRATKKPSEDYDKNNPA